MGVLGPVLWGSQCRATLSPLLTFSIPSGRGHFSNPYMSERQGSWRLCETIPQIPAVTNWFVNRPGWRAFLSEVIPETPESVVLS